MKIKKFITNSIKFIGFIITVFLIFTGIIATKMVIHFSEITPNAQALVSRKIPESSIIYDRSGNHVLYEIHGNEDRKIISHDEIPDVMRAATIAIEDQNFYKHKGFDLSAIARSAFVNARAKDIQQGGSTITQQLARNAFLSLDQTFDRKFKELTLALKIENTFSKDEILDSYLNEVSYGSNIYGIQRASEIYFRKDAINLTLSQAATLAALTKAPSYYSPYGDHKEELKKRQKLVLTQIEELGLQTKEQIELAKAEPIKIYQTPDFIQAPHFVFYVIDQLEKKFGKEMVEQGGLRVLTTLDYDLQQKAEQIVKQGVEKNVRFNAENAALVAVDPSNGEILAMVGSKDYFDTDIDGQVNVTNRQRQPGSSFKPIAYALAFEKGFQPETLLYDLPTDFGPDGSGRNYVPGNYGNSFRGLVSMRDALAMSLNIPAVKTLYLAGVQGVIDFSKKLGIESLSDGRHYGLSLVLGGGDITLLEGVSAYSVFANDGIRQPSTPIMKITARTGTELEYNTEKSSRVVSDETARKISSILSDNEARAPVFGKSNSLYINGHTVAAKTGTTQEYRDAWTIGYTPKIAIGIWVGNNDNRPMRYGAAGIFAAAPIWNEFMKTALQDYNFVNEPFPQYTKVESAKMMVTGKLGGKTVYLNKETGKEITQSKARKMESANVEKIRSGKSGHTILYYVNKDNPLGATSPNHSDPMLARWEKSLAKQNTEKDKKDN